MAKNPSLQTKRLTNPIERTNPLNEPDYAHEEGYNPFVLTRPELFTARYGEVQPISAFETVAGDRHLLSEGIKSFLDQIDGRVLSDVNMYLDYFHVPYRCIFPNNYEKIIVNPTKGDDVPFGALPQIPLFHFLHHFLNNDELVTVRYKEDEDDVSLIPPYLHSATGDIKTIIDTLGIGRLLYVCNLLSRGQLLDNLGASFDVEDNRTTTDSSRYQSYQCELQSQIDKVFESLFVVDIDGSFIDRSLAIYGLDLTNPNLSSSLLSRKIDFNLARTQSAVVYVPDINDNGDGTNFNRSSFRAALYDCFERGLFPFIYDMGNQINGFVSIQSASLLNIPQQMLDTYRWLLTYLLPEEWYGTLPSLFETDEDVFFANGGKGFINPARLVAYQMSVAQYHTRDSVDNVFNAELWMQNMRAIMYPSVGNITHEPTFNYNGVDYEYDLFTTGGFARFMTQQTGSFLFRALPFISNLFFQRRSLRYGDYFVTARPNVLAVGDVTIPADGSVSAIDVTRNILKQRFYNAVNRWGMKIKNYMAGLLGVVPSDTGPEPSFVVHQKVQLSGDTVANTADNQGNVSTNLVGNSSNYLFDVFIDDFGVMIGTVSFDTMAYYPSGVDRAFRHRDRFSMFNPMLQNIGDQEIREDELTGGVTFGEFTFGYATRYEEYKIATPRAHGGFVNSLPGMAYIYHYQTMRPLGGMDYHINPDFIRESPFVMDRYVKSLTGVSPAQYFHFVLSVTNPHNSARKMMYWPGIL